MSNYAEKLLDPRWQRRRLEILQRDNFTCQECQDTTKTLHVHHLDYEKGAEPWEYPEYYLITLCKDCHQKVEAGKKVFEEDLIKSLRLRLVDSFQKRCAGKIFCDNQIGYLFYLIWEVGVDEAIKSLIEKMAEKDPVPSVCAENGCPACGGDMYANGKYEKIVCLTCGYTTPAPQKTLHAQ